MINVTQRFWAEFLDGPKIRRHSAERPRSRGGRDRGVWKTLDDGRAARQCVLVSRLSGSGDHIALTPAPALGKTQDLTTRCGRRVRTRLHIQHSKLSEGCHAALNPGSNGAVLFCSRRAATAEARDLRPCQVHPILNETCIDEGLPIGRAVEHRCIAEISSAQSQCQQRPCVRLNRERDDTGRRLIAPRKSLVSV